MVARWIADAQDRIEESGDRDFDQGHLIKGSAKYFGSGAIDGFVAASVFFTAASCVVFYGGAIINVAKKIIKK